MSLLSRIGVGAATVDTVLPDPTLTPGGTTDARVEVRGGSEAQEIEGVYFAIETKYETDEGHRTGVVDRARLAESFTVEPDEERTLETTIDVPWATPVTRGRSSVWIETGLDIDWAKDPEDEDHVEVEPGPRLARTFDALEDLGLSLHTAEVQADTRGVLTAGRRFVQEFEFRPRGGRYAGQLDELEVVARPGPDSLELALEIDKRGGLLDEMADLDERYDRLTVGDESAEDLASRFREVVDRNT